MSALTWFLIGVAVGMFFMFVIACIVVVNFINDLARRR